MSTHWDPDFLEEVQAEESPLDPAYPLRGKLLGPARVAGRLVRYALEGPKELGRIWDRAKEGKATLMDSVTGALAGLNPSVGPGLGAGPRIKAAPWQSKTLDFVLGNPGPWKQPPKAASPQQWLSKAKSAALPREETEFLFPFLEKADPKGKITGEQIAIALEGKGPGTLPALGVTRTELGGPAYHAAQKKLDEIAPKAQEAIEKLRGFREANTPSSSPELLEAKKNFNELLDTQQKLTEDVAGKRPKWPQHQLEGIENPREILYHAKGKGGEDYINSDMRMHFGEKGKNLAWFQQEGDLRMPDGKKSTHISGLQNDWAAEYAKQQSDINRADNLPYHVQHPVPEPPMKDTWWKTGLKDAVRRAVVEGKDYLSWDTAEIQSKRYPDPNPGTHKYFQKHYDENIPKQLAKDYGVKPEKVNISEGTKFTVDLMTDVGELKSRPVDSLTIWRGKEGEGPGPNLDWIVGDPDFGTYGHFETLLQAEKALKELRKMQKEEKQVWRIPITDEIKRKVLLEGQYFTKQTAKPGGRNAEMAA